MRNNNTTATNRAVLPLNLMTLLFITLKLCGVIDWQWVFVLMPSLVLIPVFSVTLVLFIIVLSIVKIGVVIIELM